MLTKAQELYNRSISLEGKLIDLDMRLADLDTCLVALTNDSRHELDDSQAAKDMNTPNWQLLNDTKDDLQAVEDILQDLKADIDMAGDMIDEALPFTRSASEAYMVSLGPCVQRLLDILTHNSSDAGDRIFRFWGLIWLLKSPVHQQAWYCQFRISNM